MKNLSTKERILVSAIKNVFKKKATRAHPHQKLQKRQAVQKERFSDTFQRKSTS